MLQDTAGQTQQGDGSGYGAAGIGTGAGAAAGGAAGASQVAAPHSLLLHAVCSLLEALLSLPGSI